MTKYRKKPVVVEATQWFKNGDHPDDQVGEQVRDPLTDKMDERLEGEVVRFFRRPEAAYSGDKKHYMCSEEWHRHGWIDTLEGGHTVCPGDWIITGVAGERYPCKNKIFHDTYEPVPEPELYKEEPKNVRVPIPYRTKGMGHSDEDA